nr:MAG TPA: hypothetical protein [Caudoviricetes sp.]
MCHSAVLLMVWSYSYDGKYKDAIPARSGGLVLVS